MFRASNAHLQDDKVVYMQHMILSQFLVACRYTALSEWWIFQQQTLSYRTMYLGSTQPLTKMRTGNISWG